MAYNFKKKVYGSEVVDYGVPYDYASIMHYPWTAFSKNGKKTLEPIRPLNGKTPYVKLSDDDALQARRMYKCSGEKIRNRPMYRNPANFVFGIRDPGIKESGFPLTVGSGMQVQLPVKSDSFFLASL